MRSQLAASGRPLGPSGRPCSQPHRPSRCRPSPTPPHHHHHHPPTHPPHPTHTPHTTRRHPVRLLPRRAARAAAAGRRPRGRPALRRGAVGRGRRAHGGDAHECPPWLPGVPAVRALGQPGLAVPAAGAGGGGRRRAGGSPGACGGGADGAWGCWTAIPGPAGWCRWGRQDGGRLPCPLATRRVCCCALTRRRRPCRSCSRARASVLRWSTRGSTRPSWTACWTSCTGEARLPLATSCPRGCSHAAFARCSAAAESPPNESLRRMRREQHQESLPPMIKLTAAAGAVDEQIKVRLCAVAAAAWGPRCRCLPSACGLLLPAWGARSSPPLCPLCLLCLRCRAWVTRRPSRERLWALSWTAPRCCTAPRFAATQRRWTTCCSAAPTRCCQTPQVSRGATGWWVARC